MLGCSGRASSRRRASKKRGEAAPQTISPDVGTARGLDGREFWGKETEVRKGAGPKVGMALESPPKHEDSGRPGICGCCGFTQHEV